MGAYLALSPLARNLHRKLIPSDLAADPLEHLESSSEPNLIPSFSRASSNLA